MALNVLIVDDSSTMRSMVQKTIEMSGMPVSNYLHAANGQEGLECLEKEWIDVVFVDINMPVMTGLEMIERIRECPNLSELPVIVISTESSQTRIQQVHSMGVHFIHKPFTPERLTEVVRDLIGNIAFKVQVSEDQLEKIARNVLETMAFCVVLEDLDTQSEDETISASVDYSGPFEGRVVLTITYEALKEITKNMLGLDDASEITDAQKEDTVGELTNVLTGNLLSEIAGVEPTFNLQAPKIIRHDDQNAALELLGDVTSKCLAVDGGWVKMTIAIEETNITRQTETNAATVHDPEVF